MRTKDEQKREALFEATVKLVNEIGFASSSVSKIAKAANVSPSTIYVFFKSKEDLLVSTYVEMKLRMSRALLEDFDDSLPIRDILKNLWTCMFDYIQDNLEYFIFMEQFSNSPYSELVDKDTLERHFARIINVFERGIEQKIIKDVDRNLLVAFTLHPISRLANPLLCHGFALDREGLETAFGMAWDAIKL
jgi:AcrR family transcriptional regulator